MKCYLPSYPRHTKASSKKPTLRFYLEINKNAWVKILPEYTQEKMTIPAQSINLVVTSLPYGDSKTTVAYGKFSPLSLQ